MYAVTGASGQLGQLVINALIDRGVNPGAIVAIARTPSKAAGLAARGVIVRPGDYDQPAMLESALAGVDRLLLVSSNSHDNRVAQHRRAVEAAKAAGVALVAYTSILHAPTSLIALAADHRATEALLTASGMKWIFLRNGWYNENYAGAVAGAVRSGGVYGSAGQGRISAAGRRDYAEAAAVALTGGVAPDSAVELAGSTAFTLAELAATIAGSVGRDVVYHDLPEAAYAEALIGLGLPEAYARLLAQADAAASGGALADDSLALERLIGRPTTPIAETVRQIVAGQRG